MTLNELHLKDELTHFGDKNQTGSFAWWMRKRPLFSGPVGTGTGATAAELNIGLVSHDADSYATYEAMQLSPKKSPRQKTPMIASLPCLDDTVSFTVPLSM